MGRIRIEHGETTRIAKLFRCTTQTVRNALREITEGGLSDDIRTEALRTGGIEISRRRAKMRQQ